MSLHELIVRISTKIEEKLRLIILSVIVVIGGVSGCTAYYMRSQVMQTEASPDGMWRVEVLARRYTPWPLEGVERNVRVEATQDNRKHPSVRRDLYLDSWDLWYDFEDCPAEFQFPEGGMVVIVDRSTKINVRWDVLFP
tara:strand:- start:269 stop:685 length:417 start_codon:yes stop_codon:yes gene_type:complete